MSANSNPLFVSFVVPVYKAEKYLDRCVQSILNQTYRHFEIILVDDGSPDNSGIICDHLEKEHSQIKTIHQKNGGASSARNRGLRECVGDFVVFLDSDDYWDDKNGLQKIVDLVEAETDVVIFASKDYYDDDSLLVPDRYDYPSIMNNMAPMECLEYMVTHDLLNMHSSKRAYRRSFLTDNNLFFVEGIRTEDVELGLRVADCLPNYKFLNEKLYVYNHHEDSVTTTIGQKHLEEYYRIVTTYANYSFRNSEVAELLLSYVAYQYSLLLAFVNTIKPKNKEKLLSDLKPFVFLFRYQAYPRTKIISKAYRLFGYRMTGILLGIELQRRTRR